MKGIAFAGMMAVDKIKTIDSLPPRSELAKIKDISQSVGGCVCNTGIDFAKLDSTIPVSAYGVVGSDPDGDLILSTLSNNNIDIVNIKRRGVTCFTDVFQELSCQARTFYSYSGSLASFSENDIDLENMESQIFHIGYLLLLEELDNSI